MDMPEHEDTSKEYDAHDELIVVIHNDGYVDGRVTIEILTSCVTVVDNFVDEVDAIYANENENEELVKKVMNIEFFGVYNSV